MYIWIGVNDMNNEGYFVNMLNETVNYTNWASDEPNDYLKLISEPHYGGDCVEIESGKWFDTLCSVTFPALCSQSHFIGKCSVFKFKEVG